MICPGCDSDKLLGVAVLCCDACGRVVRSSRAVRELREGPAPEGVRRVETTCESENSAGPYRGVAGDEPAFVAEFDHERRSFGPGVLGFALSIGVWATKDRFGSGIGILLAVVGVAAIVFSLIPRRETLRFVLAGDSLLVGREGVPRSRWFACDTKALSEVFVRSQARTEEGSRRYELVLAFEDGTKHVLLSPLKTAEAASWLAVAIEDALGFEGSALEAVERDDHVS